MLETIIVICRSTFRMGWSPPSARHEAYGIRFHESNGSSTSSRRLPAFAYNCYLMEYLGKACLSFYHYIFSVDPHRGPPPQPSQRHILVGRRQPHLDLIRRLNLEGASYWGSCWNFLRAHHSRVVSYSPSCLRWVTIQAPESTLLVVPIGHPDVCAGGVLRGSWTLE